MAGRKRRRRTSGLGRKRAHGRGAYCVTIRKSGKKRSASTKCFKSSSAARAHLLRAVAGRGEKVASALVYRRKRRS